MSLVNQLCLGVNNTETILAFLPYWRWLFNLGQPTEAVPAIKNCCSVQPSSQGSAKALFPEIKQPLTTYRVYLDLFPSTHVGNSIIFVKLDMDPLSIATAVVSQ
jgi:hypothetical protein